MNGSRILVTGGAGFIGSHIVQSLLGSGIPVTVLDDFSNGSRENLAGFQGDLRVLEGTIVSEEDCRRAMEDVRAVSHQAAWGSVPRSLVDPASYSLNNLHGTVNILQAARSAGVRRVVMASSSSVYGDDTSLPKTEGRLGKPLSPYAASKRSGEIFAQAFATMGMSIFCLRYFNVYGPRQNPKGPYAAVLPIFAKAILRGEPCSIHGDGLQGRDFTHVDNVVAANRLALDAPSGEGCWSINVACGARTTVKELHESMTRWAGVDAPASHLPERAGDIRDSLADISLARELIGYRPSVGLEEGLARTMEWYRAAEGREA